MNRISTNQALVAKCLFGLLVMMTALLLVRPMITGAKDSNKQPAKTSSTSEANSTPLPDGLAREINSAINNSQLAYARWGVCVISLANGAVVYQRDADKLFTPASNMKIYTTGV